ncbi:DUF1036 domain-containing protein [Roseospira marina]|nr:DUF1036 domain-containing protein [Roseospira marina]MBB4314965.1 putative membrane protein [Roseospira marina]MBB5087965.1 putative membrane protein [Roseospira marina]
MVRLPATPRPCPGPRFLAGVLAPVAVVLATATPAYAGLEVCNQTNVSRWVAVGYSKDDMWTSEGWWQVDPGNCALVQDGDLTQQYYYYRAEDPEENFEGDGYMFCGVDDAFTIVGDQDCDERGYKTLDFREVDTGQNTTTFTLVLSPTTVPGAAPIGTPAPTSDDRSGGDTGLRICNETNVSRWLAVGYTKDDQWTSEGWWNVDPGQCANVISWALDNRYYYYRAEDPDENFEGDGYMFCAVDDAFTIVGDTDCESRGYNEVGFREVDTGGDAPSFTLVLDPSNVPGAQPNGTIAPEGGRSLMPGAPTPQNQMAPGLAPPAVDERSAEGLMPEHPDGTATVGVPAAASTAAPAGLGARAPQ